ncbi:MAG: hypothetical protein KDA89_22235, partial [Planctomycetaceae bacterium]|nr:hypothetical protein [Planctomycetaceae bacterium]
HVELRGGTFIERAQSYGYLETALLSDTAGLNVTMRNLGWSADTVLAESRGIFDSPQTGYLRMIEHVRAEEPTVIVLSYGQNEAMSFTGTDEQRSQFRTGLSKLYDDLHTTGAEIVFLSTHPFLKSAPPLPDASVWNPRLAAVNKVIQGVAAEKSAHYADLQTDLLSEMRTVRRRLHCDVSPMEDDPESHPELSQALTSLWTTNGMHWTAEGYSAIAPVAVSRLSGHPLKLPTLDINPETKTVEAVSGKVSDVTWDNGSDVLVQFRYQAASVSALPLMVRLLADRMPQQEWSVTVSVDGTSQQVLQECRSLRDEPPTFLDDRNDGFEKLRQLTVRKNELYFHRWRPQNITYLFGFRKHEQGNNAAEIAMFDPLIHDLEKQLDTLRQPQLQIITVRRSQR